MRNIWEIFKRDALRIRTNVIAIIAIVGITVVPCLYAWFNIAASWDPYKNTGNLKVAVASVDEGYDGQLIPIEINVGDQVLSMMRGNTQMEWIFTTKDKAVHGVRSGDYYAAIVIPKDFSRDMMSIFSEDIEKPQIFYYSNAKENAIAPKVTDKGASAIQKQINKVFIETLSDSLMTVMQSVSNMAQENGADSIASNLISNLDQISSDLSLSAGTLDSFATLTGSTHDLLASTTDVLDQTQELSKQNNKTLEEIKKSLTDIRDTITGTTDEINKALTGSKSYYKQMASTVDTAFANHGTKSKESAATLDTMAGQTGDLVTKYKKLRDSIEALDQAHPELSAKTAPVLARLDSCIAAQEELQDSLKTSAKSLRKSSSLSQSAKNELQKLIETSQSSIDEVQGSYEENLKDTLKDLAGSLKTTTDSLSDLQKSLGNSASDIAKLTGSAAADLASLQKSLSGSANLLNQASGQVSSISGRLKEMQQNHDFSQLEELVAENKDEISDFLAAPVSLKTHAVYKIKNYGSSMAPFYSTLAIWIGGIILVAMMKVTVSENCLRGLTRVKSHQLYLGRYISFLIVGLLQSTLIALGDLFYLGIQCEHPFLFMLACWFSSIVYVNIIYTLTVSFGDIGKAISVVLLVMQVAGTGGTFPIEVAPRFFQIVYPMLPFTHSMAALREAVGGFYGMDYWLDLAKLGIFMILSLILGLLLRKPVIRLNEAFSEKLEETKLM